MYFDWFQDSICSWISEPESVVNNWRGWRKNPASNPGNLSAFQNANLGSGSLAAALFNKRQQSEGILMESFEMSPDVKIVTNCNSGTSLI
jgi:hypothetical protein